MTRSKMQHRDSIKTLCQSKDIPSLNDIYAQLGHPTASHVADLRASSQDWRQQYRTQSKNRVGKLVPVLGTDLTMWTSGFSQDNLHKMVIAFLEEDGNGPKLWPSNDSEPPSDAPEYPADKEKIVELLIQLFWRQNQPPGSKRMAKESDLGIEERQDEDESRQARASQHRQHSPSQQEKNLYEFHGSDTDVEASMPSSKRSRKTMDRATSSNAAKPKATAKPGPKAKAIAKPRANTPRKRGFPGGSESCPMDISDGGDSDDDSDTTVASRFSTRRKTPSRALVASVESNPKKTKYDPQDPSLRNQSVSPAQTRSAPYLAGKQQDCLPAESNSESNSSIHNQIPPSRRRENFSESYPSPENSSPRTSPPSGVVNQDSLQEATETHVKGVKPTTPAKSSLPDHERYRTMNSKLKIRHFVITLRQGVPTSIYWRSPQLQDKTLERVFDEVAYRTSKSDIQSIEFQLVCEFRCLKYGIRREDTEVFEEMKVAFRRTIKEGKKQEITNFKILLEVDQGEPEDEIDASAVSDETDVEF